MRWYSMCCSCARFAALFLAFNCIIASAPGEDWPMFGRDATHNAAISTGNAPTKWEVGDFDRKTGVWHRGKSRNVKWVANLGNVTFGDPVVADGLVWVGTNNSELENPQTEDASVLT